ncbi:MAG: alpha/beta hydrolase [Candidatus Heimdallarchaeota archaeon]|nr:alpha/beta hydrolase [Candidatus Heimdallarchaeota archaeon]
MDKKHNTGEVILNYYENKNANPPFLYLHGAGNIWQTINPILPDLLESWSVFAYDLRGRGKSEWTGTWDKFEDHLKDTVSFVGERIDEPLVLFGWSMGGVIGSIFAAEQPESVRALILGDSPFHAYTSQERWNSIRNEQMKLFLKLSGELRAKVNSFEEYIKESENMMVDWPTLDDPISMKALLGGDMEDEKIFLTMAECWYRVDQNVVDGWFSSNYLEKLTEGYEIILDDFLPRIKCPTLIIQADTSLGGLVTDDDVEKMMSLMPNATHVKLEGIGHGLQIMDRETVFRVINEFLSKIDT